MKEEPNYIIHILFVLMLFYGVFFMIKSCHQGYKHQKKGFYAIEKLQKQEVDSVTISLLDYDEKIVKSVCVKDTLQINQFRKAYTSCKKYSSGNGRFMGDKFRIYFYTNSGYIFRSVVWVNSFNTIVFIQDNLNMNNHEYHNSLVCEELKEMLTNLNLTESDNSTFY